MNDTAAIDGRPDPRREPLRQPERGTPLDAAEIADAAVTAALVMALLATGRLLASGAVFQVIAAFVIAVLAARRRSRAVWIATAAAAAIAPVLGGLGPVSQAALAGVFGWCVGQGLKRGWGRLRTWAFTMLIGWPAMTFSVLFFFPSIAINPRLRALLFENIQNQADGFANILGGIGSAASAIGLGIVDGWLESLGNGLTRFAGFLIDNWLLLIPVTEFVYSFIYALVIRAVASRILRRLNRTLVDPVPVDLATADDPDPVPLTVSTDGLRRGAATVSVPFEFSVAPGEHVVVEGANGSGKSTLLDALAGLGNNDAVRRAGPAGLGSHGGTARVGQRPEAQVVGTTVAEDLRWGLALELLPDDAAIDATLADVGLSLPHDRPTSELSGGELQRLALASALNRSPELLLVDEVTSMLDPAEQQRITAKLAELEGTAIVRTTHRDDITENDRRFLLPRLGESPGEADAPASTGPLRTISGTVADRRLLRMRDVTFTHNAGQPWAHTVLHQIDLSIHRYEMVIIEGRNGSGKTTLGRIIAGLVDPTTGTVEKADGLRRALAYQHVRLQLLRPSVDDELRSLAGVRTPGADPKHDPADDSAKQQIRAANLETSVELFELENLLGRRIDELSGGEQRRVLLAGLVARGTSLLVLDEPLAGLDAEGRSDLARTLDLVRLAGTSIVIVSHDVEWSPGGVTQRLRLADGRLHSLAIPSGGSTSSPGGQQ